MTEQHNPYKLSTQNNPHKAGAHLDGNEVAARLDGDHHAWLCGMEANKQQRLFVCGMEGNKQQQFVCVREGREIRNSGCLKVLEGEKGRGNT